MVHDKKKSCESLLAFAGNFDFPTGTLLKQFDLKQMGLAWHDGFSTQHIECVKMIKDIMLQS